MIRICVLALLAGLTPALAIAQQEHPIPDEKSATGALEYDAPIPDGETEKPLIPSFQRRTATKAGGPANELNTGDQRAHEKLPDGNVAAAVTGRELYHGNFCGRGSRGDELTSTDPLDEACKRHDACFDSTNRACSCNDELRRDAFRVAELKTVSRELRARAASLVQAAPAIECRGD